MKINKIILVFIGILLFIFPSCSADNEKEAMGKVEEARRIFIEEGSYADTYDLLDEVDAYDKAYNAKAYAEMLRDSVKICESRSVMGVFDDMINERKILILKSTDADEIKKYQREIDSLDNIKNPFRTKITDITNKILKRAACQQCVTAMQNIRK